MPSGLKIEKIAPLKVQISESTLVAVLTTDEIRELAGYKPLDKPLQKATEQVFSEDLEFNLEEFGYAEDELEVIDEKFLDYNPFDFADLATIDTQIIDIIEANPKVTVPEIAEIVKETPKEVQARINRLIRNNLLKSTDDIKEVTDEGKEESEVTELITVYKYALRPDAPSLRGSSRDFCKNLMRANRSYELKDIVVMNNRQGSGAFAHRGGWYTNPNTLTRTNFCRHIWVSRTVKLKKNA